MYHRASLFSICLIGNLTFCRSKIFFKVILQDCQIFGEAILHCLQKEIPILLKRTVIKINSKNTIEKVNTRFNVICVFFCVFCLCFWFVVLSLYSEVWVQVITQIHPLEKMYFFFLRVYFSTAGFIHHLGNTPSDNMQKTPFQNFSPFSHSFEMFECMSTQENSENCYDCYD